MRPTSKQSEGYGNRSLILGQQHSIKNRGSQLQLLRDTQLEDVYPHGCTLLELKNQALRADISRVHHIHMPVKSKFEKWQCSPGNTQNI